MSIKTATLIKSNLPDFRFGVAHLYKVNPAIEYGRRFGPDAEAHTTDYIVVSAREGRGSSETYIFPADNNGKVVDWTGLNGSFKGAVDHERALTYAGYEIATEVTR